MEILRLHEIFNGYPVDIKFLRNLINWTRVFSWKRINPRVHLRLIRNDYKEPVFLSGDFVVWYAHQRQTGFN